MGFLLYLFSQTLVHGLESLHELVLTHVGPAIGEIV